MMPEPTKLVAGSIIISPDDPNRRRTWPDPRASEDARWKVWHDRDALTDEDLTQLARAAEAYAYLLGVSQRTFLPSHAAIRAALAAD